MSRIHSLCSSTLLVALASCAAEEPSPAGAPVAEKAQLLRTSRPVPGQYIVVLRPGAAAAVSAVTAELASSVGAQPLFTYQHTIAGFAARLDDAAVKTLLADPRVAYLAEDEVVELAPEAALAVGAPTPSSAASASPGDIGASAIQINPPWGLDRIDQRNLPLSFSYAYGTTGAGVHAYVIGTGVRATHVDFGGRVGKSFDAITPGGTADDCNGNGTFVAGLVGGATYGVAKKVQLHAVRVLSCAGSGTTAQIIAGIDWVTANGPRPAVATLTVGGGANDAFDAAVNASIAAGVTYTVVAGASGSDACNFSPGRIPAALTTCSSTSADAYPTNINRGPCIDLCAPGQLVLSTWHTSDTATMTLSGSTTATGFSAGAAARYLQSNPAASPAQVTTFLNTTATMGVLTGVPPNTPNRLLYLAP